MSITLLRHTLATVAYRGGKTIRDVPPEFSEFRAGPTSRSAGEILVHTCDLFDWALSLADGEHKWKDSQPDDWPANVERFHAGLAALDARLAVGDPLGSEAERLFQGPIADALTHIGQIAMLRRLAGHPVRGENYFRADIAAGHLGPDQAVPAKEFD